VYNPLEFKCDLVGETLERLYGDVAVCKRVNVQIEPGYVDKTGGNINVRLRVQQIVSSRIKSVGVGLENESNGALLTQFKVTTVD